MGGRGEDGRAESVEGDREKRMETKREETERRSGGEIGRASCRERV